MMQRKIWSRIRNYIGSCFLVILPSINGLGLVDAQTVVNDVSQLNPIIVNSIHRPHSTAEIAALLQTYKGTVSIGGGHYSMGGQTASENTLHLDLREMDSILWLNVKDKEICVQTGITWRKVQAYIDSFNLSVQIMQSYANFTVGGSLGVNVHGRSVGKGPIIFSVQKIKMILADGKIIEASPIINQSIFYSAIGGYGGLGVITEVVLKLDDNCRLICTSQVISWDKYAAYFVKNIRENKSVVFHNADIYPKAYKKLRAISYSQTDKPTSIHERLRPLKKNYFWSRVGIYVASEVFGGKWIRQYIFEPLNYLKHPVEWRNYQAGYHTESLEPKSRKKSTYLLQEYFIPVEKFDVFYPILQKTLKANKVNVINISIRHSKADTSTTLSWARNEVFSFVIYYKQKNKKTAILKATLWTRGLIDQALRLNGTYYLPYQIYASKEQFQAAYPNYQKYFNLKKQLDPLYRFRNKLWDTYYTHLE